MKMSMDEIEGEVILKSPNAMTQAPKRLKGTVGTLKQK
jgi:hypothetical protein